MKPQMAWHWGITASRACVLAGALSFASLITCLANESVSLEQLNDMERRAEEARRYYWRGEYAKAIEIFNDLTRGTHPSVHLYRNELGLCQLAAGDYGEAERCLADVAALVDRYVDQRLEREALSKFGKEEAKIYRGDPYEQATSFMLLALLFLNKGDLDNALAACKSGILSDSDATENKYDSDYTLLHLIEGKCHLMRGSLDDFRSRRDLAVRSVQLTHRETRAMVSEQRDTTELLRMTMSERKKVNCITSDADLKSKLESIDHALTSKIAGIDPAQAMGPFYTARFNTLVVVPMGRSPVKVRKGKDGHMVAFDSANILSPSPVLTLDGALLRERPLRELADVEFQATTRNGRRMDAILNGKVAFRSTTVGVGDSILQAGNNVGGEAGLAIALIGAAVQGIGGAMTPEADTRCWKTLPCHFDVYALDLPPGRHAIGSQPRLYFDRGEAVTREFFLKTTNDVAVVFLPPGPVGLYSEQTQDDMKLAARDTFSEMETVQLAIPPLMGLERVMRFRDEKKVGRADAVAPDLKKAMRNVRRSLEAQGVTSRLVTHEDAISRPDELAQNAPMAIQIVVGDAQKDTSGRQPVYRLKASLSLVDTQTGSALFRQDVTGESQESKAGVVAAFYECLDGAVAQFVSSRDFMAHVSSRKQTASKQ